MVINNFVDTNFKILVIFMFAVICDNSFAVIGETCIQLIHVDEMHMKQSSKLTVTR